jgi:CDP-glycerol glycerophosphotransferase
VVPVYNVEAYLADCLESILSQSYRDLEVVVVDDGATDRSAEIAERYVRVDPRVRIVRQSNAGLGAARNAGIRCARGAFLALADSDDLVPPRAYETLMGTIERTGSDMASGALRHVVGRRRRVGRLMQENHVRRREGVTLTDMPLMLADVFAVNKVFRRTFWDAAGLEFPEGVRYEDQPTLTKAFLAARRFDVLPEVVYLWQRRRDKSSITQARHDVDDLRDRVWSKRVSTADVLAAHPHLRDMWFGKILPVDMWEYFRASVRASDEFWRLLREAMSEFWNSDTVPFTDAEVPVQQRLMGRLVQADRRDDLRRVVAFVNAHQRDLPVQVRRTSVVCPLPGIEAADDVPPGAYTLAPHELTWQSRILHAAWDEMTCVLRGFALVVNVPTAGRHHLLAATALGPDGVRVALEPKACFEPRATQHVGRPSQNYDDCGFELHIDLGRLLRLAPPLPGRPTSWRLLLRRSVEAMYWQGGIAGQGGVELGPPAPTDGWHRVGDGLEARLAGDPTETCLELRRG